MLVEGCKGFHQFSDITWTSSDTTVTQMAMRSRSKHVESVGILSEVGHEVGRWE